MKRIKIDTTGVNEINYVSMIQWARDNAVPILCLVPDYRKDVLQYKRYYGSKLMLKSFEGVGFGTKDYLIIREIDYPLFRLRFDEII